MKHLQSPTPVFPSPSPFPRSLYASHPFLRPPPRSLRTALHRTVPRGGADPRVVLRAASSEALVTTRQAPSPPPPTPKSSPHRRLLFTVFVPAFIEDMASTDAPVALVTGAAKRIGRGIAEALHAEGYAVMLHYSKSAEEAKALAADFNSKRPDSAAVVKADLSTSAVPAGADAAPPLSLSARCAELIATCYAQWGRCDVLVNNASAYYPTPLVGSTEDVSAAASDLFGSNAIAPYFLTTAFAQRVADTPAEQRCDNYSIINMVDAMTHQPLHSFTMYTMGKAALEGLTRSAALELAPLRIRVNGVGPGLSTLPVDMPAALHEEYRRKVPLYQRESTPAEIAHAVLFLCSEKAKYISGSCLNVDACWSLTRT